MTRSSNTKVFTLFANPERQFQSRKDITPIAVHNIYSFYESESSESELEDLNEINIETLMLEQYLALNRNNSQVGVLDSRGLITRLTAVEALDSIQEIVDHSHRWHKEESDKKTSNNSLSTLTDKLINLNHDMNNLMEDIHKINLKSNMKFCHEDVKSLGNPRPVNMVIEMADRSMQSPKGIVENTHASYCTLIRIDVFGEKILLEVGKEQVIFDANEGATPVTVSPVCVIKDFDVIDNIEGPDDLEDFLMDDDLTEDLGNFIQDNNLFLNYEDPGANPPSPNKSPSGNWNPVEEFQDSDDNLGNNIVRKARNLQVFIECHSFLTDFIILENVNEFVKKGLTEVLAIRKEILRSLSLIVVCVGDLPLQLGEPSLVMIGENCGDPRRIKSKSEDLNEIDIETLTVEQYLAQNRNNSQVGLKRPRIGKNIVFEIKSQLLRELRETTFSGGKIEDSLEHLRKILEIASLFNTPGILGSDIML
ncbi:hypothetical protein Tco_0652251 [Tanacetum coccineum]|uniref:Uncharacterized protein n=1 Tax=Tanacetum coccineum TaxID=301880 RepID=A0ABQ4WX20_9ASTR